ncbi:hypothetical protein C3L50_06975 [Flavobacterium alvei]|uniref:Long-chain fatty acid transport protein n=1 Tax=Flavobacterium alvei TaxID=2080416 RepID=A0A2S5ADL0_9FLAO|nr:hypothetical protein [Flavobacterium alvei]POY40379.1 hypothetical protein C3L50_06975 [Flavobacterium alvei]HQF48724.1 hypothetical protein [Flavobacterium alvei]HQK38628.1 hypothetical protein [Flavobacterium alvei]
MIKKFLISSCLLLSLVSFSQEGTSSPYSFYGIGEARFNGSVESRTMGGISMIPDSTRINFQNPAGYANIKWTNFTIGGSSSYNKQKSGTSNATTQRTTLDYLALAIPLGKFGAGFGLIPYSSVGYKIENIYPDGSQNNKRFNGWGGTNRVFLGTGYRILPNWSIGANVYYNFGKIQTNSLEFIPDVPIGTRELNVNELSGVNFNIGMMYQYKLKEKLQFFSSLYYTPKSTLVSNNERIIGTVSYNSNYDLSTVDTFDPVITKTDLQLPQKWSLGLGIGNAKKWVAGGEVSIQDVGKLYNNYNTLSNVTYGKYQRYSVGGYFTPNANPFMSYAKRITYRGGFVFEKTGLIVNSTSINDVGMTLGLGFPITGSLSNLNLGLEFGKKGTTSNNLVQENYFIFNIGFSLNDKWFVKSKYN